MYRLHRTAYKIISIIIGILVAISFISGIAICISVSSEIDFHAQLAGDPISNTWQLIDKFCLLTENKTIHKIDSWILNMEHCDPAPFGLNPKLKLVLIICVVLILPLMICRIGLVIQYIDTHMFYSMFTGASVLIYAGMFLLCILWTNSIHGHIIYQNKMHGHIQGFYSNHTMIPTINSTFTSGDLFATNYCTAFESADCRYLVITDLDICVSTINPKPLLFLFLTVIFVVSEIMYFSIETRTLADFLLETEKIID